MSEHPSFPVHAIRVVVLWIRLWVEVLAMTWVIEWIRLRIW